MKTRTYQRIHKTIFNPDIYKASNSFVEFFFKVKIPIVQLGIKTLELNPNFAGRDALICDTLLTCEYNGIIIKFKIEKVEV